MLDLRIPFWFPVHNQINSKDFILQLAKPWAFWRMLIATVRLSVTACFKANCGLTCIEWEVVSGCIANQYYKMDLVVNESARIPLGDALWQHSQINIYWRPDLVHSKKFFLNWVAKQVSLQFTVQCPLSGLDGGNLHVIYILVPSNRN